MDRPDIIGPPTMRLANFLRIFLVTAALAGYSAWPRTETGSRRDGTPSSEWMSVPDRVEIVSLEQAAALWKKPDVVFIDVRAGTDYDLGHITGAIHLEDEDFDKGFPAL